MGEAGAMFVVQGPVDPRNGLFFGRSAEIAHIEKWLDYVHCVGAVLGARQTGKTSLLLRSREISGSRYGMVFVNFEAIEGATPEACFSFIAGEMLEQLGAASPGGKELPKDGPSFLKFLRGLSGWVGKPRVGVLLDEVGALPSRTGQRLAHTLRASFTNRHVHPELERYVFVVAGSMDLLELTAGRTSPLKNVTESVYLADLNHEEACGLLRAGFQAAGVVLTEAVESAVLSWGGGHPYWTQLLGSVAAARPATRAEEVEELARDLLESEDRNLPHLRRTLSSSPALLGTMVDRILHGEAVPFGRHDPTVAALELSGVVTEASGRCAIRTRFYEEVLRQWRPDPTPPPRVGPPVAALPSLSVFVSYAHADEKLRVELGKHLAALERQGLISTWHDRMLTAGDEWAGTIDRRLEEAQVILLLVSADFVQSRYCYDVEMKRALERHQRKEALVLPVILRPVALGGLPFAALQALPRDARPVTDWPSLDAALLDVTEGVRAAIAATRPRA